MIKALNYLLASFRTLFEWFCIKLSEFYIQMKMIHETFELIDSIQNDLINPDVIFFVREAFSRSCTKI